MICSLKNRKQRKLRRLIARDVMDMVENQQPFYLKGYMLSIYNMVKDKTNDHAKALDYARITPFFINQIVASDLALMRGMNDMGLSMDAVMGVIMSVEDPESGISRVEEFLGIGQEITDELRELNEDNPTVEEIPEQQEPEVEVKESDVPVTRIQSPTVTDEKVLAKPYAFTASPWTMMANVSFESIYGTGIANPLLDFVYKVQRNMIKELGKAGVDYDSRNLIIPGYGPVYITAMPSTEIPEEYLRDDVDLAIPEVRKRHETGVSLMLTTEYGSPIFFDKETGKPVPQGQGKPVYYHIRRTEDFESKEAENRFNDYKTKLIDTLAQKLGGKNYTSQDKLNATAAIESEMEFITKLRKYLNEDKTRSVQMYMNGGTMGYTKFDYNKYNHLISEINFDGEAFIPRLPTEKEIQQGLYPGEYYFTLESMYERPIQIERAKVKDSGLVDTIISLLTDDLVYEDTKGNKHPVNLTRRKELLQAYISLGPSTVKVFDGKVMVGGQMISTNTPEEKAGAKEILSRYFTSLAPTREIKKNRTFNKKVIVKESGTDYKSKYKLGSVLKVPASEGSPEKYFVIEYAKHDINKALLEQGKFDSVEEMVPQEDGSVLITTENKPYTDYIKDHFTIHYELNEENKLVRLDSYFTFAPVESEAEKVYGESTQEQLDKDFEESEIETSSLDGEGDTDLSADDLLSENLDDPELQKNFDQKKVNKQATKKQMADARVWYENHPMSKHFPFEQMFTMVNTKSPGAVATWTVDGITLYKGADYSDLYHEAWHGFTQGFLTKGQKKDLYRETRKKSGSFNDYKGNRVSFKKATDLQIEEFLAEDFRKYMLGGRKAKASSPVRNNIFRRIWNFLKSLFEGISVDQVVADHRANQIIDQLYEKLKVGNLQEYTFAADNVMFGTLNSGIQPFGKKNRNDPTLLYENSRLVVETVDALISEFIDLSNSGARERKALKIAELETKLQTGNITKEEKTELESKLSTLKLKSTYSYTSKQLKSSEGRLRAYKYVRARLQQIHKQKREMLDKTENAVEIARLNKDIELLDYSIRNFGDTENLDNNRPDSETGDIDGVIAYHATRSEIFPETVEDVFFDELDSDESGQYVAGREGYDRLGNESSVKDLAGTEVLTLLHTLYQYKDGQLQRNKLGVARIVPFRQVWNRLVRMLSGHTLPEMYQLMQEQQEDYPPIKQLLAKLGPIETASAEENMLWTTFWRTFNMTRVPLIQMTNDLITEEEGVVKYETRIGEATGEFRKIGRQWDSQFRTDHDNYYTTPNSEGVLYLDIEKVLKDFPKADLLDKQWEFFNAIGIKLSDKKEIKEQLEKRDFGTKYFYDKIIDLKKRGNVQIKELGDIIRHYPFLKIGGHTYKELEGLGGRYKNLQELEQKYSDISSNFMVSTATGNTQSEYTLNSTLTQLTGKINKAEDYQSLIAQKETAHYDIRRNPFIEVSQAMNRIFVMDVDKSTAEFGNRRKKGVRANSDPVSLILTNLSGALLQKEGMSTGEGVESAKADPYSKLILDLHLMVQSFNPELPRHGDKSTSYSLVPEGDLYIPTTDFFRESMAHDKMVGILTGYIGAELKRVNIMRDAEENGLHENYDQSYVQRGKNFVYFDKILSKGTKDKLYELDTDLKFYLSSKTLESKQLLREISEDIENYFEAQYQTLNDRFSEAEFISDSLYNKVIGDGENIIKESISREVAKGAMIKSLVYNTWINNAESSFLLYGDIAQYKVEQDDFHKRDSGVGSTGLLARTDKAMLQFINHVAGRGYAKSIGATAKAFDGSFDTAVIADKVTRSAYMEEYAEVLGKSAASTYMDFEETDAMGLVSFDSYRILKIAQGQWLPRHEQMYQQIIKGETLDAKTVKETFFPVIKAQYYGPLAGKSLPLTAFHKFELMPLIPDVIKNSPKLTTLHDKMTKEGVDYVVFQSGSKVSTITKGDNPDVFYDENREISEEPFTKNTIFVDYLKDQLEIAPKYKGEVTFPTQLRTLVEDGMMEYGIPVDFMKGKKHDDRKTAWDEISDTQREKESSKYALIRDFERNVDKLTQLKKKQLLKRAEFKLNDDGTIEGDFEDLIKWLKVEMKRLDMGDHEIDFLQIHKGKLKSDASMALFASKLESTISSMIDRELINQKVTGEALIQVSGALFESAGSMVDRNYTNPTEEELKKWGSNDLPFYHKGADGKTRAMKVKIALQGEFKKLLRLTDLEGKSIRTIERLNELLKDEQWLNTGDHRRMVTMSAVRIPVQGLNSMEFMEVYEFLPEQVGNIVVLPAEIVAKSGSDYDIDKLTVMMPSFRKTREGTELLRTYEMNSQEAKDLYEGYKKFVVEREKMKDSQGNLIDVSEPKAFKRATYEEDDFQQEEILNVYSGIIENILNRNIKDPKKRISISDIDEHYEDILLEEGELKTYEEFVEGLNGTKAVENELVWSIKSLLEHPDNYENFIMPNTTDDVKPLAEEMALKAYGKDRTKPTSGSDVMGYEFNLDKHHSNNSAKRTLSIGAVGNKWNPLFNRVGAHLNPSAGITPERYKELSAKKKLNKDEKREFRSYRRQKLFFSHNAEAVGGHKVISFSALKDNNPEKEIQHRISNIISQMMNGWVDVAKDDWIADIQGNEEITPTMEFMLEAGVPLEDIVYLVSLPMVRDYVKEQQLYSSTFATALDKDRGRSSVINAAKAAILNNDKYGFRFKQEIEPVQADQTAYKAAETMINAEVLTDKGKFDTSKLLGIISNHQTKTKAGEKPVYGPLQRAAFLHFLEIEQMAAALRDIKLKMNVDTTRTGNLFETQNKIGLIKALFTDSRFPKAVIQKIVNDSPISSFFLQEFKLDFTKGLFGVRNHPEVNRFLTDNVKQGDVVRTFGKKDIFANEFRNDLMSYIFQNSFMDINIDSVSSYRGLEIRDGKITEVQDGVFYLDRDQTKKDFESYEYIRDLKEMPFTSKEYYRFRLEREYIKHAKPYEQVKDTAEYKRKFDLESADIKQEKDETNEDYKTRLDNQVYERYIRDKALDNVLNISKLFTGKDTYADQFMWIRKSFPQLEEDFAIVRQLSVSTGGEYTNLQLNDKSLDGDMINLYHENLIRLADSQVKKVDDPEANQMISTFFAKFPMVAFLQSGLNTKSAFSMVRIVPQDKIIQMMTGPTKEFMAHFNKAETEEITPEILKDFYKKFVARNSNSSRRIRGKNYSSEYSLSQSVQHIATKSESSAAEELTEEDIPEVIDMASEGEEGKGASEVEQPPQADDWTETDNESEDPFC